MKKDISPGEYIYDMSETEAYFGGGLEISLFPKVIELVKSGSSSWLKMEIILKNKQGFRKKDFLIVRIWTFQVMIKIDQKSKDFSQKKYEKFMKSNRFFSEFPVFFTSKRPNDFKSSIKLLFLTQTTFFVLILMKYYVH